MEAALLVLVALAAGVLVGVLVGRWVGRAGARTEQVAAEQAHAAQLSELRAELAISCAERDAAVRRADEVVADRAAMTQEFRALAADTANRQTRQAAASAEQQMLATEQLMAPVRESLDRFNQRLTGVEKERVAMATDLAAHVRAVRDTGETLRRETAALSSALSKPQVRGAWGETQLKRVAELAGMVQHCDFDLQTTATSGERTVRPDMRVNLAEGKHVFVDSKVPLAAFLEAAESDDGAARAEHFERFARHVRTHVDSLSSKQYWKAADSPEFVVLFLPSEAFYMAARDQMPDLDAYAASRDVVIATPTTLIALLRAVGYGWRQRALADSAAEVFGLARELYDRLGRMGNRFDKLGRALRTSVTAYNETIATVEGSVLVQARRLRDLNVTEAELASPRQLDDSGVRQIQAAELVEDAIQVQPMLGRRAPRSRSEPEGPSLFDAAAVEAGLLDEEPDIEEIARQTDPPLQQQRRRRSS